MKQEECHNDSGQVLPRIVQVLLISEWDEDHAQLAEILQHSKWERLEARSKLQAMDLLTTEPVAVAICDADLPDATWRQFYSMVLDMPQPPMVIVMSRHADDRLWSEVLHLGAYNVIAKPLVAQEVFHVVSCAWLYWKGQRQHPARSIRAAG